MRMVLVELSRFRSRRAIALMLLAATLLTALIATTTLWSTRPLGAAEMRHAQVQAQRDASSPQFRHELRRCQADPAEYLEPNATAEQCAQMMTPRAEWYLDRQPLRLESVREDAGLGALLLLTGVMVIVGATFAGADWASGSMSNQLLFEPRRSRVWLGKAGAVLVGAMVATAVIMTGFWAAMFLAADARGIATPAAVQESIRAMVGRGVVLAGLGALGAFSLTMLLRHTVGTLAVLVGYAAGGTAVLAALPFAGMGRWSVDHNVFAWLRDGYTYFDDTVTCRRVSDGCSQSVHLSLTQGATYLGVILAVVVVFSVLLFRRRDVP